MAIGDRLKEIRKSLELTQAEFGEKMGLKQAVIGQMESCARNITDRTYILLQERYNVNIEWLKNGFGEMFIGPSTFSLDEYAKNKSLGEKEIALVREFMNLDPTVRSALFNMFKNASVDEPLNDIKNLYEEAPKTPEELEKLYPPNCFNNTSDVS